MTLRLSTLFFGIAALAAAAPAAASKAHFRAEPLAAPAEARLVVRDTVFRCGHAGCVAPRGSARAGIVCSALVREVGALRSFSADGRSFGAEELAECNRAAR
jgi:hypothetical protein